MANVLPFVEQVKIVAMLEEGVSIRAASRLCGPRANTIVDLGLNVGLGCLTLHDRLVHGVEMKLGEADEIYAFVRKKENRKTPADPIDWGETYTMFVVDAASKLIPSFRTGKRDLENATAFMCDLRKRIVGKPQLSVDGWPQWPTAVERAFGPYGCHLGVVLKEYQTEPAYDDPRRKHNPGRVKHMETRAVLGSPDMRTTSTCYAERVNVTTRTNQRRFTRKTNGHSKKLDNHCAAVALHFMHYNFVRVHDTLKTTPAVAAGLEGAPWSLAELVRAALDAGPPALAPPAVPCEVPPLPTWETWQPMVQQILPLFADEEPPTVRDPVPWGSTCRERTRYYGSARSFTIVVLRRASRVRPCALS